MKPEADVVSGSIPEIDNGKSDEPDAPHEEISTESEKILSPVTPENFNDFSYSKKSHFKVFDDNGYDQLFYGEEIEPEGFLIKTYQNFLVFSFIKQNIPEGSRILEIGNGDDYIINHFQYLYECWRIDDAANLVYSNETLESEGINLLKDNKGKFHSKIPKGHFDFVFSTTGFYTMSDDEAGFETALHNIEQSVKPGGYSLHCFPAVIVQKEYFYYHPFLSYMNLNIAPIHASVRRFIKFPRRENVIADNDLHFVNEIFPWGQHENEMILDTVSFNFLWMKQMLEVPEATMTNNKQYLSRYPSFVFHHIMKCGGTSVKEVLQNWFQTEYDYLEEAENKNHFLKYKLNISNINADSCIAGHFQHEGLFLDQRYPELFDDTEKFKLFSFVRDPLDIRISLYYYNKNNLGIDNLDLVGSLKYFSNNFLASLFNCTEDNYKQILDRYFFIGIVEKMQESFDKLAELLNKKKVILPYSNKSTKDSQVEGLTPEFISKFKEQNKLDYLIYDYCLEKFDKL